MVRRRPVFRTLCALLMAASVVTAVAAEPPPLDREAALRIAHSIDTTPARQALLGLTLSGNGDETVLLLEATRARADWPVPARERALFDYTQTLRTLPSDAVPVAVMNWLKTYPAQTQVTHDDFPTSGVPLYNVRGTAQGVENSWRLTEARLEALALLASNPRSLVDAFTLEPHPAARQGYVLALDQASTEQLRGVSRSVSKRLHRVPELTGLGGRAALIAHDLPQLKILFVKGSGPDLAPLMRAAATALDPADTAELLRATLNRGPAANATLALAELAPAAMGIPGMDRLLMDQLAHPERGSTAALTLARHASPELLAQLDRQAEAGGDPLGAARARLALNLYHDIHGGEASR